MLEQDELGLFQCYACHWNNCIVIVLILPFYLPDMLPKSLMSYGIQCRN
jgi:hypothetical protein